ncbi:MAG: hypothetical protein DRP65_00995 [Planctomycetota bacterium]|nr:MAG: hypothetical protein DRP65_00995 [Planctomycetota bacterium]
MISCKYFNDSKSSSVLTLLSIVIIALAVYWPGLNTAYYADDYQFVFDEPASKIFYYFAHPNKLNDFYRPIQASFLAIVQTFFGLETWPIHLTQLSLHITLALLVYIVILEFGFSRLHAGIGAVFMLISQTNVHAVLSNDTLSQVGGTFFGSLSLWFLYLFYRYRIKNPPASSPDIPSGRKYYILSVGMLMLSLFSKETSASFPLMIGVLVLAVNLRAGIKKSAFKKGFAELLPFIFATCMYLCVWLIVVESYPTSGSANYNLNPGANIIVNIATLLFALIVPVSSVMLFSLLKSGLLLALGAICILTLTVALLVLFGLWHTSRRLIVVLIMVFALLGLFPVVLMNHVSELYTYNSLPFMAVLFGIGLGNIFLKAGTYRFGRISLSLMLCSLIISHAVAAHSKARLMADNGSRLMTLVKQIRPYMDNAPPDGTIWLRKPTTTEIEYSIFCMPGFKVMASSRRLWHRADVRFHTIPPEGISDISPPKDALVLTLHGEKVVVER